MGLFSGVFFFILKGDAWKKGNDPFFTLTESAQFEYKLRVFETQRVVNSVGRVSAF